MAGTGRARPLGGHPHAACSAERLADAEGTCSGVRLRSRTSIDGYKRLTWDMVDRDIAYLRPGQVYQVLQTANLLARRPPLAPDPLRRPAPPDRPDQVWHIDLMYLYIKPRWYYLVDILDGYSRYLVHWKLHMTMHADLVMLTVQEALETLSSRRPGEPQLVHDHRSSSSAASGERSSRWRELAISKPGSHTLSRMDASSVYTAHIGRKD